MQGNVTSQCIGQFRHSALTESKRAPQSAHTSTGAAADMRCCARGAAVCAVAGPLPLGRCCRCRSVCCRCCCCCPCCSCRSTERRTVLAGSAWEEAPRFACQPCSVAAARAKMLPLLPPPPAAGFDACGLGTAAGRAAAAAGFETASAAPFMRRPRSKLPSCCFAAAVGPGTA